MRKALRFAVLILTPLAMASSQCGGDCATGPDCPTFEVEVSPSFTRLRIIGATVEVQATALGGPGNRLTGKTFTWTSSDDNVVTVRTTGLATAVVTAVANGTATITATSDGAQGSMEVMVAAPSAG